ncbi:MAG: DISARM system SNF2-like helicase DrmD [Chthoniobacteraceae bacterium]
MPSSTNAPEPGQIVQVRQRPFVVIETTASLLPDAKADGGQHFVRLSSVEDDALGEELEVVWELEAGAVCMERSSLPNVTAFDEPAKLDAFLDAVRWGAVSQADDKAIQSPFRSGIEVEEYQLDPVVRALQMPRVNLLIADDVGLGKTIETGLVAQELILRHRARTILIVCPSSIQVQWRDEMREKFGLDFRIIDSDAMSELRRRRGIHVNPWSHFPRLITSLDFLKRERPLRLWRETLGGQTYPRRYDLLIVDEAHNVAPSGRGRYAIDSQRTEAIRELAPHFEHKLFLTATPHNGYRESFAALLELLDNQRFTRAMAPSRAQLEAVMVRRMKSELEIRSWNGTRRFAKRAVLPIEITFTDAEKTAHAQLQRYTELRTTNAASLGERFAAEFVLKLLKKRLFSSPAAFASTLERHAVSVGAARSDAMSLRAIQTQLALVDEDYADDAKKEEAEEDALAAASRAVQPAVGEEKQLLASLRTWASNAAERPDSKAHALLAWLDKHLRPGGQWCRERVIIFTEYRTTQKWLQQLLAERGYAGKGPHGGERLMTIYGGVGRDERESIKAAFQADPDEADVRILLATDAASEGLNLQNHCTLLIHVEIPWNPNRMEQRNGRIDRHGQDPDKLVQIHHFVGAGFDETKPGRAPGELEGDLEFLMRAALKVNRIREDLLGKVGTVIADQVEEAMLGQRRALDTVKAERDSDVARKMLKFERDLRTQLKKLHDQLDDTVRDLRLTPANVENVVLTALALAGQPPLASVALRARGRSPAIRAWHLPAAFSGAWRDCLHGLEHPHSRLIRPVTFNATDAEGRDDVVLAHLGHRLVQMCLRLLRAEVWSMGETKRLHRVTARIVPDAALREPVIIAHSRLVVLGADNHRLHEEIFAAGGHISGGKWGGRLNVGEAKAALDAATAEAVPGFIEGELTALWPKLQKPLLDALDARMHERTKNLQTFLDERCEREVGKITAILNELAATIGAELDQKPDLQLTIEDFKPADLTREEATQRDKDIAALKRRRAEIPAEIERETTALRARYREPSPRDFPICVTFLVPPRAVAEIQRRLR